MVELTDDEILQIRDLASSCPPVGRLLEFYTIVSSSPYYESYCTARAQVTEWNDEISKGVAKIKTNADDADKTFERVLAYLKQQTSILSDLDAMRSKMTPSEQEDVAKKGKIKKIVSAGQVAV